MGKGVICLRVFFISALLAFHAGLAEAQYFGHNKVEYVDFEFRVLHTEHFDIYHYPREEAAARLHRESEKGAFEDAKTGRLTFNTSGRDGFGTGEARALRYICADAHS